MLANNYWVQTGSRSQSKNQTKLLTGFDYHRIRELILQKVNHPDFKPSRAITAFMEAVANANVVPASLIPPNVVTMKSVFCVRHSQTQADEAWKLVFPNEIVGYEKCLSCFHPLGMAILGAYVNDEVQVDLGGETHTYRLLSLEYQPEACGDYYFKTSTKRFLSSRFSI